MCGCGQIIVFVKQLSRYFLVCGGVDRYNAAYVEDVSFDCGLVLLPAPLWGFVRWLLWEGSFALLVKMIARTFPGSKEILTHGCGQGYIFVSPQSWCFLVCGDLVCYQTASGFPFFHSGSMTCTPFGCSGDVRECDVGHCCCCGRRGEWVKAGRAGFGDSLRPADHLAWAKFERGAVKSDRPSQDPDRMPCPKGGLQASNTEERSRNPTP